MSGVLMHVEERFGTTSLGMLVSGPGRMVIPRQVVLMACSRLDARLGTDTERWR